MAWNEVIRSIENSRKLLQALWEQDEKAVAEGIDQAHGEISVLQYNNENSLSCTIALAFYFAREYYKAASVSSALPNPGPIPTA